VFCRLRYRLTLRVLSEIMSLRGIEVSHEGIRDGEAMIYGSDPKKAAPNLEKYGVAFCEIERFQWETALVEVDDRRGYGEQRWRALVLIGDACMLSSSPNGAPSVSSACVRRTGKRYRPMSNAKKAPSGIHWPTDEEEAAIQRGIAGDPDAPELTATERKAMRPTEDVAPELLKGALRRRGPQKSPTRELITIRLDREVTRLLRSSGPGWQTRVAEALKAMVTPKPALKRRKKRATHVATKEPKHHGGKAATNTHKARSKRLKA
jgi:uncharacterized protein (DUF4415 family)/uncharacterized DUF497 family protein